MIRAYDELFVGSVSVALGLFFFFVAVLNWEWYFSLRSAQIIQRGLGRVGARIFYLLLGTGLLGLGIAIALGFGPNKGG
jgi:small neutral amino acid transporter SnatA (MarC family)